ncbi:MAG: SUMF1/EgtB/PvdO family nonheme iron enzyme [Treponema sp.]|nr:SUMF1/EgtB/PvdO family nonheme iron enzyme [Treponema sp.]
MTKLQLKLAQIYEEKGYESARLFWAEIQENMPALAEKERSDLKTMMSRYCKIHGDEAYLASILSERKKTQTKESIGFFFDFARIHHVGENVAKNESKSEQFCKMILDHGDSDDLYKLGKMYRSGDGVAKNESKAAECFKKSAVEGNKLAAYLLGEMYMLGCGVEKNRTEAENWYNVANAERNMYSNTISRMVIPCGITKISDGAFEGFENVRSVVLPAGLKRIGANAFKDCKNLERISIANEKIIVGTNAFKGCENLDEDAKKLVERFSDMVFVEGKNKKGYYIAKYLVTQELYESVMGMNPSFFQVSNDKLNAGQHKALEENGGTANNPVENVSWYDAICFCNKLSMRDGLTPAYSVGDKTDPGLWGYTPHRGESLNVHCDFGASGYRLPTNAEWMAAASDEEHCMYSGSNNLDDVGWYNGNSKGVTHPVGQKMANKNGLYDMSGNVYEWGWDDAGYDNRFFLGGSYRDKPYYSEVTRHSMYAPAFSRDYKLGFRFLRICN